MTLDFLNYLPKTVFVRGYRKEPVLLNMCRVTNFGGMVPINTTKCSWNQKAFIYIDICFLDNYPEDKIAKDVYFSSSLPRDFLRYPLVVGSVQNHTEYLDYLSLFDNHLDILSLLTFEERYQYLEDQLSINIESCNILIQDYFRAVFDEDHMEFLD